MNLVPGGTETLMERVASMANLKRARERVRANKVSCGVDGESVAAYGERAWERLLEMRERLLGGTYRPSVVRRRGHCTKRNRGRALGEVIGEVNRFAAGWLGYFRLEAAKKWLSETEGWLQRRLRCCRLKQAKRRIGVARFLMDTGWFRLQGLRCRPFETARCHKRHAPWCERGRILPLLDCRQIAGAHPSP